LLITFDSPFTLQVHINIKAMKIRLFILTSLGVLNWLAIAAQTPSFELHDKVLNVGIGIGGYNTGYNATLPPLSASFEVGVKDNFLEKCVLGVGGYLAYAQYKQKSYSGNDYWTYSKTEIGVRGSLHYPLIDKLDTYASLMLGYKLTGWTWNGMGTREKRTAGTGAAFSLCAGARYYFTDKFAAMGELGLGICILNLGVALKF